MTNSSHDMYPEPCGGGDGGGGDGGGGNGSVAYV